MSGAGPELKKTLNQAPADDDRHGWRHRSRPVRRVGNRHQGTGPGAFLTYALCASLIIMVMRMLAEMAVANPSTGSFADYSRKALGDWAASRSAGSTGTSGHRRRVRGGGGRQGHQLLVAGRADVGAEPRAHAPHDRHNLISVSSFGEFEFWFAGIKVARSSSSSSVAASSSSASGQREPRLQQPHGARRFLPDRRTRRHRRRGHRHLLDGRRRDRDHRGRRVERPRAGRSKAANSVITRIAIFFVGSIFLLAVILRGTLDARGLALRRGLPGDGHPVRRPRHERRRADGRPLVPQLRPLHRLAHALRPRARREAPAAMVVGQLPRRADGRDPRVVGRRLPRRSSAAISPDTVFSFLLNSSGAVILFVYLLIAISQIILRRRDDPSTLKVEDVALPDAVVITTIGINLVLVQMGLTADVASSSCEPRLLRHRADPLLHQQGPHRAPACPRRARAHRRGASRARPRQPDAGVDELVDELQRIDAQGAATYYVCVPASPVETGTAATHGAVSVRDATTEAAQRRLERTLELLTSHQLEAPAPSVTNGRSGPCAPPCRSSTPTRSSS